MALISHLLLYTTTTTCTLSRGKSRMKMHYGFNVIWHVFKAKEVLNFLFHVPASWQDEISNVQVPIIVPRQSIGLDDNTSNNSFLSEIRLIKINQLRLSNKGYFSQILERYLYLILVMYFNFTKFIFTSLRETTMCVRT